MVLLLFLLLAACSPEQQMQKMVDKAVAEPFTYSTYSSNGFSVKYPYWPETGDKDDDVEVAVSRGYCSVAVNQERIPAEPWFGMVVDSVENSSSTRIILKDDDALRLKYSTKYQNLTLINEAKVYGCNDYSYVVLVFCIEQAADESQGIYDTVFGSAECEESEEGSGNENLQEMIDKQNMSMEYVDYVSFEDDDFRMEHPDWAEMDKGGSERVLGVSAGICSVVANRYNALPGDIAGWIEKSASEKGEDSLIRSSRKGDYYYIDYRFGSEDYDLVAKTKMFYCNYMTYSAIVVCLENVTVPGMDEMTDEVLSGAHCAREYEIPTPKVFEEKREEVEEDEPEELDEIEESIVKTNAGEAYGIDEEMVVYFINNNAFFTKIMKDFPEANLEIEDKENDRNLELKVDVDPDTGQITSLDDGAHSSPDVTLIIPLRDALNIFSNAQNLNPLNLLAFAVNVKTEPAGIKDQVIRDVLSGKYK
ncbi:hypothetical protein KY359_03565 [Candidatus Woesearchaeota archaeon]|nr:hypothetical protein [Candidatus Woesearchaeota archaeon]